MAGKNKKPKHDKGKRPKKRGKAALRAVDLFSPAALLNAYYICHNAAAFLHFRGYAWPGSQKKKGKGKEKK